MQCIDDYINGNLTDAKRSAKHYSFLKIFNSLLANYGKTQKTAIAIANYLKGEGSFQAACDAEDRALNK